MAEQLVRTVWRILLGLSSDASLIARATVFYAKGWNRGTFSARLAGPGRAEALLEGWPDAPDFTLRGVCVALDAVLRLAGRHAVEVVAERHPRGARWRISWQTHSVPRRALALAPSGSGIGSSKRNRDLAHPRLAVSGRRAGEEG